MSRPVSFDLIDKVLGEVGEIKETEKNKRNMDEVINLIKTEGYNLPVYYYKGTEDWMDGGLRPYRLYEFTARYQYDSESEDDDY